MNLLLFPFFLLFSVIDPAYSECACHCVDGSNLSICDSSSEQPPVCAPEMCPALSFEMPPTQEDEIEPIGTQRCVMRQVYENDQYVWRSLCE